MLDIITRRSQSGADAPDRRRDPRFRGPRKRGDHTDITLSDACPHPLNTQPENNWAIIPGETLK